MKESKARQASSISNNGGPVQAGKKLSKNELRLQAERLQALEDEIHEKEIKLAELSEALQDASHRQDVASIRRLSETYAETEAQLAELLSSWEKAHE